MIKFVYIASKTARDLRTKKRQLIKISAFCIFQLKYFNYRRELP